MGLIKRYKMGFAEFEKYPLWAEEDNSSAFTRQHLETPCENSIHVDAYEHPSGEWVKYEDVKLWIETKPPVFEIQSVECNCKEKIEWYEERVGDLIRANQSISLEEVYDVKFYWMCPAHGYKKR